MNDPSKFVENSDRLLSRFVAWPSFHDAEVHSLDLWRGDIRPEHNSWIGPVVTAKVQVLGATQPGATQCGNDTLVTLRFHDVDRLQIQGFNHENAIIGLLFEHENRGEGLPPYIRVQFISATGGDTSFVCMRIEVLSVQPYVEK